MSGQVRVMQYVEMVMSRQHELLCHLHSNNGGKWHAKHATSYYVPGFQHIGALRLAQWLASYPTHLHLEAAKEGGTADAERYAGQRAHLRHEPQLDE
jgi:hypothetical protein